MKNVLYLIKKIWQKNKKNGWHFFNQQIPHFMSTTAVVVIQETTSTSTQAKGTS